MIITIRDLEMAYERLEKAISRSASALKAKGGDCRELAYFL